KHGPLGSDPGSVHSLPGSLGLLVQLPTNARRRLSPGPHRLPTPPGPAHASFLPSDQSAACLAASTLPATGVVRGASCGTGSRCGSGAVGSGAGPLHANAGGPAPLSSAHGVHVSGAHLTTTGRASDGPSPTATHTPATLFTRSSCDRGA